MTAWLSCVTYMGGEKVPAVWSEALKILEKNYANSLVISAFANVMHYKIMIITVHGDDNFVKVVEPQLGPSVGTLYFGHSGNHYVPLKLKQRASSYATAARSSKGNSEPRTRSFSPKIKEEQSAQEIKTSSGKTFKAKRTTTTKTPKGRKNQEMEWWESTEEYNPGTSLWRGRKISDDTSSYGSDLEIIEEKETPKDKSLKKSKQEIKTTVADISDQSVVEISSDDGMEVDSPLKQPTRKR